MNNSQHDPTLRRKSFLIDFAFFALIFVLSIFAVRYALPALFSFVIAFLVTMLLRPVVRFCHEKLKLNRRVASLIVVLLFYGTIGVLVIWMTVELVAFAADKVRYLPDFFQSQVLPFLDRLFDEIQEKIHNFDPETAVDFNESANTILSSLGNEVLKLSANLVGKLTNLAVSVPTFLLKLVIMVIATIFLMVDYETIRGFIRRQLSDKTNDLIHNIFTHLGKVIKKYLLSYSLIMLITFGELWAGLSVIRIRNAALIAALIAIMDILPIVGSGLALAPWAVVCFFIGDIGTAIGLLILWAVISVIRQFIEPKIVGESVGVHPFLTLFAMLAGNFIYGGIGILLLPVTIALCQSLNNAGVIKLYKTPDPEPQESDPIQEAIAKGAHVAGLWITRPFKKRLKAKKIEKTTLSVKEPTDKDTKENENE